MIISDCVMSIHWTLKDKWKNKYEILASEHAQMIRNMKKMGELSTQLMDANKTIKDLEKQLTLAHDQVMYMYKLIKCSRNGSNKDS